jgi:NADH:ubiquinone oxidoreductase subunit K
MIGLPHYLLLGSIVFCIGVFGVLTRRNAVAVLMSVELMLNAVNINFIAANKYIAPDTAVGQLFSVFVMVTKLRCSVYFFPASPQNKNDQHI